MYGGLGEVDEIDGETRLLTARRHANPTEAADYHTPFEAGAASA